MISTPLAPRSSQSWRPSHRRRLASPVAYRRRSRFGSERDRRRFHVDTMPIAPSQRAQRFIEIYATGEHSQAQAYKLAGYSDADTSNSSRMARKYAAEIAAHREKLGLAPIEESAEALDDPDRASLIVLQRRLYADALEARNLPIQRAALREIGKLLKRPRKSGRPAATKESASTPQQIERDSDGAEAIVAALLLPEDIAEIEATWADAPPWGRGSKTCAEAQ